MRPMRTASPTSPMETRPLSLWLLWRAIRKRYAAEVGHPPRGPLARQWYRWLRRELRRGIRAFDLYPDEATWRQIGGDGDRTPTSG